MKKTCAILFVWTLLFSTGAAFGQYSGRAKRDQIRISVRYTDGRPKARGYLLEVSDSGLTAVARIPDPARVSGLPGGGRRHIRDTILIASSEIARLRIGSKARKRRVMQTTILSLVVAGGIVGYIAGVQSDVPLFSPEVVGIFTAVVLAGYGFEAGIPLGFVINDLTKKTHRINGDEETFRKIVPQLQRY